MRGRITLAVVMAAFLVPAAAIAAPDAAGWQHGLAGIDQGTVRAIGLEPVLSLPLPGSEISRLGSVLPDDQMEIFTRVTRWKRLTIAALGINTGAVLITLVDPFVANILGILSLGFFTVSSGYMAFGYRDLIAAQALTAEIEPDPRFPYMASLIAAGFGMGAMTAFGFAFESEAAAIIGAVCTVVSGVSGIIAVVRTSAYSRAIDYPSYTRQMQGTSQSNRIHNTAPPAPKGKKPQWSLSVPLVHYSY